MDWHLCLRVVGTMALVPMCWVGVYMTVRSLVNVFAEKRDPEWSSRSRIAETTQHCDHLHRDVTSQECGLCWNGLRGDAEFMRLGAPSGVKQVSEGVWSFALPFVGGWDACREKHIGEAPGDRP